MLFFNLGLCVYVHCFRVFFREVYNTFGVVTSFTGTYRADEWSLVLSSSHGQTSRPFHGSA